MKKNRMMRIASCLLVLVLLTTCVISGTFAKYVTSDDARDVAQVAKWGVNVEAKLDDLFETAYDNATGTVQAAGSYNILAPGTSDTQVAAFTISGTPEVAVNVNVTVDVQLLNWTVMEDADANPATPDVDVAYCPLVITVGTDEYKIGETYFTGTPDEIEVNNAGDLEIAVEKAIQKALGHGNHDAKTNLNKSVDISWNWPFSTSDENDVRDTKLGNKAEAGTPATFDLGITITVTQVD